MHHVHHIFFLNIFAIIPARKDFVFNLFAITPAHGKIPSIMDPVRGIICFLVFLPESMRLEKSHLVWTLFADTYVFECFSHSPCSWKNPLTVCNLFMENCFLCMENCFFVCLPKPMLVENPPPRLQSVWRKNLSLNLFAITPVHRISPSRLDLLKQTYQTNCRAFLFYGDAGAGPIQSANECSPAQTKHRI